MSVGNWRDHLLIKCAVCSKLMGHHKPSTTAVCVDCEMLAQMKKKRPERGNQIKGEHHV